MLLGEERIIFNELLRRYPDIEMPESFKENIDKLAKTIHLKKIENYEEKVSELMDRVDSVFIYEVLRATIHSQCKDSYIKALMAKYAL